MTRDERADKEGFVAISTDDDCEYWCVAKDYTEILSQFTFGKAFILTETLYGEKCTIKTARIISVTLITPESRKERIRNDKERAEREQYDH